MNSLLYYYNNVQKMAAYRQAKRMQRGAKLGYGSVVEQNVTKFQLPPINIGTNDFSIEFYGNTYGSESAYNSTILTEKILPYNEGYLSVYYNVLGQNGVKYILFERSTSGDNTGDRLEVNWVAPSLEEKFLLTITRQGTTVKVYINGKLKATKEQSEVKDLGDLQLAIANSSDVGFVRVWNMCLSADDVTAHYNNGDPMGYVVPKAYRRLGPSIEPVADTFEFNIGSSYSQRVTPLLQYPNDCIYLVDYVVDEWDYAPKSIGFVGFIGISGTTILTEGASGWYTVDKAKVGESRSLLAFMPNAGYPGLYIYGGQDFEGATARRLKVTINSITPVGLLAEYLPQNLMYGRDDKTIALSWLDSAKQLPLYDEYMEPLFQSIGGYDMAANGAPEILYNE